MPKTSRNTFNAVTNLLMKAPKRLPKMSGSLESAEREGELTASRIHSGPKAG